MGKWPQAAPLLAHYVGAPDKLLLMKCDGVWNLHACEITSTSPHLSLDAIPEQDSKIQICFFEYMRFLEVNCTDSMRLRSNLAHL